MDYKKIKTPNLEKDFIKKSADIFRKKYYGHFIPVDIEKIIETKLKINVIPVPEWRKTSSLEALIASDWESIYVDKDAYENQENRLKFSLAHEIGHLVLHKEIWENLNIRNIIDFYRMLEEIPRRQYGYLETQANYFAGFLLVPQEELKLEKEKLLEKFKNEEIIKKADPKMLNSYLAQALTDIFDISAEVIENSLNTLNNNKQK